MTPESDTTDQQEVKEGDTIKVHYTGSLADGSVFDSSAEGDPLEFIVGDGSIIKGVDRAVMGMKMGEKKKVAISPEEAYGHHRDDLILQVPREELGPQINPEVGMMLRMRTMQGQYVPVKITEVTEAQVTLDANHPLAGETLTFDLEVVSIS